MTLSLIIFAPVIGALVLAFMPRLGALAVRVVALGASLSTLVLAGVLLASFNPQAAGYQFVERHAWIASLNAHYFLGLDGMSLILVILTGLLAPAALAISLGSVERARTFAALFLALQGAALGVFLALDFFHWFLFWEASLVPAYFLIRLWGGRDAARAAYQFVIYTLAGSVFLLLAFAALFVATGTLDFTELARLGHDGTLARNLSGLGHLWPSLVFAGVLLGLAVKVPLYPFHTWLPLAYAEAPTGVSMFLTGVMSKMGVYGFIRILWSIFPGPLHAVSLPLLALAVAGAVFGALCALRQTDLKRMVAYSSLNHLSYCLIALFAVAGAPDTGSPACIAAMDGTLLQVFNHGLSAAALFLAVGVLESRAGGLRSIDDFGGVRTKAPLMAGLFGVALFSSLGLPGLNGFVGEFLIFRGVFPLAGWAASVSLIGLLATAIFLLTFWQKVYHGPVSGAVKGDFADLSGAPLAVMLVLAPLMLLLGWLPQLLVGLFNPLVTHWLTGGTLP